MPHGIFIHEATAVAVNSKDEVFVFNRGNMPVLVFDIEGNLIRHWGNKTPYDGKQRPSNVMTSPECAHVSINEVACYRLERALMGCAVPRYGGRCTQSVSSS